MDPIGALVANWDSSRLSIRRRKFKPQSQRNSSGAIVYCTGVQTPECITLFIGYRPDAYWKPGEGAIVWVPVGGRNGGYRTCFRTGAR